MHSILKGAHYPHLPALGIPGGRVPRPDLPPCRPPLSKAKRSRLAVIKFRQTDEKKFRSLNVERAVTEPCRDLSGIGS